MMIFCVTHKKTTYVPPAETNYIILGDPGPGELPDCPKKALFIVKAHFQDLDFYRPYLLGTAGLLAIKRVIESFMGIYDSRTPIVLTSYRKAVINHAKGRDSVKFPTMKLLPEGTSVRLDELVPRNNTGFLYARPLYIGSILQQYAEAHKIEDFLRYLACCGELRLLTTKEIIELMLMPYIIPSGIGLGCFPFGFWYETASKLERVAQRFIEIHKPVDVSLHQRRAVDFSTERLSSFLLWKKLKSMGWPESLIFNQAGFIVTYVNSEYDHNVA